MVYKDPEVLRIYKNNWSKNRRNKWIASQGNKCAQCGSDKNLEVDHIDKSLKVHNPRVLWGMSDSNPVKIAELANCQVLCHECHLIKTRNEKWVKYKHGDLMMYKNRKCRCDKCRAANAERVRVQRARIKAMGLE